MRLFDHRGSRSARYVVLLCIAVCGCSRKAEVLNEREERDPLIQRALGKKRINDVDGAIEAFEKALARKPYLSRPHFELGVLYVDHKEEYVRGIYHFERYLEMRPDTQKKDMIQDMIRYARNSFMATLPDHPPGMLDQIESLNHENRLLRNQIRALTGAQEKEPDQPSTLSGAAGASRVERVPTPAPARPILRRHKVEAGETLSRIARKWYNDPSKSEKIFQANRDVLDSPNSLQPGQVLNIPE